MLAYFSIACNHSQHPLARGSGAYSPKKIVKITSPEIESGSSFDGNL